MDPADRRGDARPPLANGRSRTRVPRWCPVPCAPRPFRGRVPPRARLAPPVGCSSPLRCRHTTNRCPRRLANTDGQSSLCPEETRRSRRKDRLARRLPIHPGVAAFGDCRALSARAAGQHWRL